MDDIAEVESTMFSVLDKRLGKSKKKAKPKKLVKIEEISDDTISYNSEKVKDMTEPEKFELLESIAR